MTDGGGLPRAMSISILFAFTVGSLVLAPLAQVNPLSGMLLLAIAPYALLTAFIWITRSSAARKWALALMIFLGLLALARVTYSLAGYDHWLLLPLVMLGAWEAVAILVVAIAWALARRIRLGSRSKGAA